MKIIVGSTNQVKVEAVREVFGKWLGDINVESYKAESGVSDQPMSDDETVQGARNRAKASLASSKDADYGVGIEGGMFEQDGELMACAWCVVVDKNNIEGLGGGLRFEVPRKVQEMIKDGVEMGDVMNEMLGRESVKHEEGAIGVLSKKMTTRQKSYEEMVKYALVKFISAEIY